MNSIYAFGGAQVEIPAVTLSASPASQDGTGTVTLTAAVTGDYGSVSFSLERTDKNGDSQSAPALSGSGLTRTFTPAARGDTYLATAEVTFNSGANTVSVSCIVGTTVEPALEWRLVCDIDFAQEADQALSGGNLTVTNRADNTSVVLTGQTVAIASGKLEMTAATSSNLAVASKATRTAALLGAAMTTIWPDFDGQPIRWGAEVSTAPTFDVSTRAWGVFAENETGLGGGNAGLGFTAEIRSTGVGTATRHTRYQFSSGSSGVVALNSTAYAAGLVAGIGLEGNGARGFWSLNPGDAGELDVLTQVGAVGAPGGSEVGTAIAGVSQLGVFAAASTTGAFVVSVERLVLWARVPTVGP